MRKGAIFKKNKNYKIFRNSAWNPPGFQRKKQTSTFLQALTEAGDTASPCAWTGARVRGRLALRAAFWCPHSCGFAGLEVALAAALWNVRAPAPLRLLASDPTGLNTLAGQGPPSPHHRPWNPAPSWAWGPEGRLPGPTIPRLRHGSVAVVVPAQPSVDIVWRPRFLPGLLQPFLGQKARARQDTPATWLSRAAPCVCMCVRACMCLCDG